MLKNITLSDIYDISGREFEDILFRLFICMGYTVEKTPVTGDQGADLILTKNSIKTSCQAKRYSYKVTNKAIQEVYTSKKYYNCDKAMVVTNNYFTNSAKDIAKTNNVELIDATKLKELLSKYSLILQ